MRTILIVLVVGSAVFLVPDLGVSALRMVLLESEC